MDKNTLNGTETSPNYIQCSSCSDGAQAISWCVECDELICITCVAAHRRIKASRNHTIKTNEEIAGTVIKCKSCSDDAIAEAWCFECSEFICGSCVRAHQRIKTTKNHTITSKAILCQKLFNAPISSGSRNLISHSNHSEEISIELFNTDTTVSIDLPNTHELSSPDPGTDITASTEPGNQQERSNLESNNFEESDQGSSVENRARRVTVATNTNISSTNMSLSNWFNLSTVLNATPDGKAIMKYYEDEGLILPKHRKMLNKLILNKTFSVKDRLSVKEREEIAQQIGLVFHNEESNDYFRKEKGLKAQILSGTLQAAYSYRTSKMSNKTKRKRVGTEDIENNETQTQDPANYFDDNVQKSFQNIQENLLNDDMAITEWDNCFQFRNAKMSLYKTFDEIWKDWPFFVELNGFSFIEHDFQKFFGGSGELLLKWPDFVETNVRIIGEMINHPKIKHSLNDLNVEQGLNEKSMIFFMALFHLPNIIQGPVNFGPKRWRPTVKSSKISVFKRVYSRNSIAKAIKARKIERDKNNIQNHPIIYGIGEYIDEMRTFFVALGDVLFEFNSFVEALDASFKCYKVLRLDYPKESVKFWRFIDSVFYKTETEKNPSSITSLINSLQLDY